MRRGTVLRAGGGTLLPRLAGCHRGSRAPCKPCPPTSDKVPLCSSPCAQAASGYASQELSFSDESRSGRSGRPESAVDAVPARGDRASRGPERSDSAGRARPCRLRTAGRTLAGAGCRRHPAGSPELCQGLGPGGADGVPCREPGGAGGGGRGAGVALGPRPRGACGPPAARGGGPGSPPGPRSRPESWRGSRSCPASSSSGPERTATPRVSTQRGPCVGATRTGAGMPS